MDNLSARIGDRAYAGKTYAGCDVSCDWIDVACRRPGQSRLYERRFDNTSSGHRQLIEWLGCRDATSNAAALARVVVEASGIYSLDLALALDRAEGVELMVAHPKAVKDYRGAQLRRSKTDQLENRPDGRSPHPGLLPAYAVCTVAAALGGGL